MEPMEQCSKGGQTQPAATSSYSHNVQIQRPQEDLLVELDHPPAFVFDRQTPENLEKFTSGQVKRLKCRLCTKTYRHLSNLRHHLTTEHRKHHEKHNSTPKHLLYSVVSNNGYTSSEETLVCPECGKKFSRANHLTNHLKGHAKLRRDMERQALNAKDPFVEKYFDATLELFVCNVCQKSFKMRNHLSCHLTYHGKLDQRKKMVMMRENRYLADRPTWQYGESTEVTSAEYKISLDAEVDNDAVEADDKYWNPDLKQYQCDQCDKTCVYRSHLTNHLKNHVMCAESDAPQDQYWNESTDRYECDKCSHTFAKRIQMTIHARRHERMEQYKSDVLAMFDEEDGDYADDTTEIDPNLTKYWNAERKLYECDACDRTFKQSKSIKHHQKGHDIIRNDEAEIWEKLNNGQVLNREDLATRGAYIHLAKYWSETNKRYECDRCPKVYILRKPMAKHLKSHRADGDQPAALSDRRAKDVVDDNESESNDANKVGDISHTEADQIESLWNQTTNAFECDKCNLSFEKRAQIKNHISRHERMEQFKSEALVALNKDIEDEADVNDTPEVESDLVQYWSASFKRYECDQCDTKFRHSRSMRTHLKGHDMIRHDDAEIWKKLSVGQKMLKKDLDNSSKYIHLSKYWKQEEGHYECDRCSKIYISRKPMAKHLRSHEPDDDQSVEPEVVIDDSVDVEETSSTSDSLWNPVTNHFECPKCQMEFPKRILMSHHLRLHEQVERYKTDALEMLNKEREDEYAEVYNKLDPDLNKYWNSSLNCYECDQCGKQFKQSQNMKNHLKGHDMIRHEEMDMWQKLTSGKKINREDLAIRGAYIHLSRYWNDEQDRYECNRCDKIYISRKPMAKHLRSHDPDKVLSGMLDVVLRERPAKSAVRDDSSAEDDDNGSDSDVLDDGEDSSDSDRSSGTNALATIDVNDSDYYPNSDSSFSRLVHGRKTTSIKCKNDLKEAMEQDPLKEALISHQFECNLCTERFAKRLHLKRHIERNHMPKKTIREPTPTPIDYNDQEMFLRHHFSLAAARPTEAPVEKGPGPADPIRTVADNKSEPMAVVEPFVPAIKFE